MPIPGYEGRYEASNTGNILSWVYPNNGQILETFKDVDGYHRVTLKGDKDSWGRRVHQLVAAAHLGKMPDDCCLVRHYDDNKDNNSVTNLRYGTHEDNRADWVRNNPTLLYSE